MEKNRLEIIRDRFKEKAFAGELAMKSDYEDLSCFFDEEKIADFYEKEITSLLEDIEGEIKKLKVEIEGSTCKIDGVTHDEDYGWGNNRGIEGILQILKSKRNEK